jgi:acetate kinase
MGGLDNIVFSGSELEPFIPVIYRLLKKVSFLGINLKSLPWTAREDACLITSPDSKVKAILNRTSLPNLICRQSRQIAAG